MSEEKNTQEKSDNNMKIAVTIVIFLVGLLAITVFALQQTKNKTANTDSGTGNTTESTQTAPEEAKDAGALGKNEIKLTNDNFKAEVEDYKGIVLVDFYLTTCPYCQNVAKNVTAVSDELAGKIKVGKLDARANKEASDKFSIESVPTFIVFKDGKEAERTTGEKTKQQLLDMANKYLK